MTRRNARSSGASVMPSKCTMHSVKKLAAGSLWLRRALRRFGSTNRRRLKVCASRNSRWTTHCVNSEPVRRRNGWPKRPRPLGRVATGRTHRRAHPNHSGWRVRGPRKPRLPRLRHPSGALPKSASVKRSRRVNVRYKRTARPWPGAMRNGLGERPPNRCPCRPVRWHDPDGCCQPSGSRRTSASDRLSPDPRARCRALLTSISLASRGGRVCTMAPSSLGVK